MRFKVNFNKDENANNINIWIKWIKVNGLSSFEEFNLFALHQ